MSLLLEKNKVCIKLLPSHIELLVRGPLHHVVDPVAGKQRRGYALQRIRGIG